ncbi:MAG: MATE family efflux transporter, partial [Clostridiales bacterium]|nr:MATE family efflux transporter [Clostridiales bacterium]
MEERNILGEEKIYKLLIKFSLPAIVGMTVNSLYNVVDRIFIGNSPDLGMNGLAGITIAFPIMIIIMAVGILFGVGGATRFAIKLGEGDKEEAEKTLGSVFTMLIISSIVLTILGLIFLKPLVVLFGASEEVAPFAVEYLRIIILGSIFKIVSMGLNNIIRADGSPKIAMYTMLIGAITNIILDPIFIFGFRMGMFGAGLATIIAQSLSFIWVILYFAGKRSNNKLRLRYMKPDLDIVKRVVGLGIPDSTLQIANSVLNTVLNRSLLFYGGDLAVSVMGIINSVATLLLLPVVGLRQGLQPIISFNYGAKKYPRVKQAL